MQTPLETIKKAEEEILVALHPSSNHFSKWIDISNEEIDELVKKLFALYSARTTSLLSSLIEMVEWKQNDLKTCNNDKEIYVKASYNLALSDIVKELKEIQTKI